MTAAIKGEHQTGPHADLLNGRVIRHPGLSQKEAGKLVEFWCLFYRVFGRMQWGADWQAACAWAARDSWAALNALRRPASPPDLPPPVPPPKPPPSANQARAPTERGALLRRYSDLRWKVIPFMSKTQPLGPRDEEKCAEKYHRRPLTREELPARAPRRLSWVTPLGADLVNLDFNASHLSISPEEAVFQFAAAVPLPEGYPVLKTARGYRLFFNPDRPIEKNTVLHFPFREIEVLVHVVAQLPPGVHPSGVPYRWVVPPSGPVPVVDVSLLGIRARYPGVFARLTEAAFELDDDVGDGESHRIRSSGNFDAADYFELVGASRVRRRVRVPKRCPTVVLRVCSTAA